MIHKYSNTRWRWILELERGDGRSGEVLKLRVGKNLEGVFIRGHVLSLIDQCGENTPVWLKEMGQQNRPDLVLVTRGHDEG